MATVPVYCTEEQSFHRISVQSLNKSIRIQGTESFGDLGPNPRTEYHQEMTPPGGPSYERAVVEDLNMVPRPMSTSASPKRFRGGTFLTTPEQHRRRAEQLQTSNPELARHHLQLRRPEFRGRHPVPWVFWPET
jgi:hypothetical protein